jgi:hypothetical protein
MSRKKLHTVNEIIEKIKKHSMTKDHAVRFVDVSRRDGYLTGETYNRLKTLLNF